MNRLACLILFLCSLECIAQDSKPWFMETAIRLTTDAENYFLAPSFSIGVGRNLNEKWSIASSYTFFGDSDQIDPNTRWTLRTHTFDLTPNFHFNGFGDVEKKFHAGIGLAYQFRKDTPEAFVNTPPSYLTMSFDLGYRFSYANFRKPFSISISLKAFGPYVETSPSETYIEILTQLMLGLRWRY